ncbi:MAG: rod shape-determining protein MreD [Candidatus Omnitrophota bacterium]|jgi:rod shape-determining protein MreD
MNRAAKAAYFGVILLCAVLQAGEAGGLKLFGVKPDLLFMTALMSAVLFRRGWVPAYSAFAGVVKDYLSIPYCGLSYAFIFPLWALVAQAVSRRISLDKWWLRFLLVFCVVGLNDLAVRLWGVLSGCASVRLYIFIKISFLESLLTALCAAVFFDRYPAERLKECLRGTVKRLSLFRKTAAEKEMAGKERK